MIKSPNFVNNPLLLMVKCTFRIKVFVRHIVSLLWPTGGISGFVRDCEPKICAKIGSKVSYSLLTYNLHIIFSVLLIVSLF